MLQQSFAGLHFRRQVPIRHFIADFASHRAKLVIEVDGGQHCGAADAERTRIINQEGYRVLRFWNNQVLENPEGVWKAIDTALNNASGADPLPSMGMGRGGVTVEQRGARGKITPAQPSPIEGEGL
jgi:very-short-patch-repair endonuclease